MRTKQHLNILLPVFVIGLLLALQQRFAITEPLPKISISKQETAFNLNDEIFMIFNLGQKRLLSSIIWIETLMESDTEHYQNNDLGSWMYLRFNTLNRIDPNFYEVYRFGGQYLSIVKDDLTGAAEIYERGLKLFPDDFWLNFHAGFHYFFEMGNRKRSLEIFKKIAFRPEAQKYTPYLPTILGRIQAEQTGVDESLFSMLFTTYAEIRDDGPLKDRLYIGLYAIRAEIDLNCLNNGGKKCRTKDFDGVPYQYNSKTKKYQAQKAWKPFRIKKKRPT